MDLAKLLALRAAKLAEFEAVGTKAEAEKRGFTADELKLTSELEQEIKNLDETIKRAKAQRELMKQQLQYDEEARAAAPAPVTPPVPGTVPAEPAPPAEKVFRSFGEQLQAIYRVGNESVDPSERERCRNKLQEVQRRTATGSNTQVDADGGFLIAAAFAAEITKRAFEVGTLWAQTRKVPMPQNANQLNMRALKDDSRLNGQRLGGIQAYWVNEADTATPKMPTFRMIKLDLKKILAFYYTTDEELEDAPLLESIALQGFSEEIAFMMDDAILRGDGQMQPLGIFNSQALISVPKVNNQQAGTIVYDNILDMYARFTGGPGSAWYANIDCLPQLAKMSLPVGTAGTAVWLPAGGAAGLPYDTLMGRPVRWIEQAETCGTQGDLTLFDPKQYLITDKGGVRSDNSMHVRFLYGEQVFRVQYRTGGQPQWDKPVTPYKGSNKRSPYVVLATRS